MRPPARGRRKVPTSQGGNSPASTFGLSASGCSGGRAHQIPYSASVGRVSQPVPGQSPTRRVGQVGNLYEALFTALRSGYRAVSLPSPQRREHERKLVHLVLRQLAQVEVQHVDPVRTINHWWTGNGRSGSRGTTPRPSSHATRLTFFSVSLAAACRCPARPRCTSCCPSSKSRGRCESRVAGESPPWPSPAPFASRPNP